MQPLYAADKVNNEIEFCEVMELGCKELVERALLRNRISYYIRWPKKKWYHFGRNRVLCIICVNDNVREQAEEVVTAALEGTDYVVNFAARPSENIFL